MDDPAVTIRTPLHPTERRELVEQAVRNLFPDAEFEEESGNLVGRSEDVDRMSELVETQEINETAHEALREAALGDTLVFRLSKQPATVGRLNFDVGGHELGALRVRIEAEDTDELVEYLTGGRFRNG